MEVIVSLNHEGDHVREGDSNDFVIFSLTFLVIKQYGIEYIYFFKSDSLY